MDTKIAIWLDVKDEFLLGRIGRFVDALEGGSTVVFDVCELFDGVSSKRIGRVDMPDLRGFREQWFALSKKTICPARRVRE